MVDTQLHLWPQDSRPHTLELEASNVANMIGPLSRDALPAARLFTLPAGSRVHPGRDLTFLTCFVGNTGWLSSGSSARGGLCTNFTRQPETPSSPRPGADSVIWQNGRPWPAFYSLMCPLPFRPLAESSRAAAWQASAPKVTEVIRGGASRLALTHPAPSLSSLPPGSCVARDTNHGPVVLSALPHLPHLILPTQWWGQGEGIFVLPVLHLEG